MLGAKVYKRDLSAKKYKKKKNVNYTFERPPVYSYRAYPINPRGRVRKRERRIYFVTTMGERTDRDTDYYACIKFVIRKKC